jgi:hypothetical protein
MCSKFWVEKAPNSASRKTYRVAIQNRKTKKLALLRAFKEWDMVFAILEKKKIDAGKVSTYL